MLERFRKLIRAGDQDSSLWPEELNLEPYPGSWKYFLQSLLKQMDQELDEFIEQLCVRLKAGESYAADREMFKTLFQMLVESRERVRFSKMIQAVHKNKDALGEKESQKLNVFTGRCGNQYRLAGQSRRRPGHRPRIHRPAAGRRRSELASSFFWMHALAGWSKKTPKKAVEKGIKHLEQKMHGGSGKALLLNLIGCAHDELKEYPQALGRFKEASESDPDQIFSF